MCNPQSNTLSLVIIVNATLGTLCVDSSCLGEFIIIGSTVNIFFENGVGLDVFELGLEVFQTGSIRAAIGSATSIGQVKALILNLLSIDTPK